MTEHRNVGTKTGRGLDVYKKWPSWPPTHYSNSAVAAMAALAKSAIPAFHYSNCERPVLRSSPATEGGSERRPIRTKIYQNILFLTNLIKVVYKEKVLALSN